MRLILPLILTAMIPFGVAAQDQPNTILVMDGSGSMWGQIDGVAKITIAQQVVSSMLEEFPIEQGLGLTVYGHRERGNCTDIETIVAPATGTVGDIVTAVNGIKPLGKTPMTDAIIAAAEALRYTEEAATVILVSDGVETCNPDPCAAARLLEEAAIDFTAHVIGFDVDDEEALAQMQCIASETGGQFLSAANAEELDLAMTAMVLEPDPVLSPVTLEARLNDENGGLAQNPIAWTVTGTDGDVISNARGNPVFKELGAGRYTATAFRSFDNAEVEAVFHVASNDDVTVTVVFPQTIPDASVSAPPTAMIGETINVDWTGPDRQGDQIITTGVGQSRTQTFAATADGSPAALRMPPNEGTYEIHYLMRGGGGKVLASTTIDVIPAVATISAPAEGVIGETISVDWTGPDYTGDMIVIALPDRSNVISPKPTSAGPSLEMTLPNEPGTYEIRYRMQQGGKTLALELIEVTAIKAKLEAPDTAFIGETVTVTWDGPNYDLDYIAVGPVGEPAYENYTYTRDGNPLGVQMPAEPGVYELRYTLHDSTVLVTKPIEVTAIKAQLIAPDKAIAGETVTVGWDGPDYDLDYIAVAVPGETGYVNYTYTSEGNPLGLEMPAEAGTYEIQYRLAQDAQVIGTKRIEVSAPEVTLTAADTATAGSKLTIDWTGPNYELDYIAIAKIGDSGYENYTYTSEGNPLALEMPTEPGSYEIRYTLRQDGEVLLTRPIEVTAVKASIDTPTRATAGETLSINWNGPDYDLDYIAVGPVGEKGYVNYTYTREGNPLPLQMPPAAGDFEIRYHLNQDGVVIFRQAISIDPVKAQLMAPEALSINDTLTVGWDGPDYTGDYIGIAEVGASGYKRYAYTSNGNPVTIEMPDAPGDYELRYFMGQGGTVIANRAITIGE